MSDLTIDKLLAAKRDLLPDEHARLYQGNWGGCRVIADDRLTSVPGRRLEFIPVVPCQMVIRETPVEYSTVLMVQPGRAEVIGRPSLSLVGLQGNQAEFEVRGEVVVVVPTKILAKIENVSTPVEIDVEVFHVF